jgi:hypothetical protein
MNPMTNTRAPHPAQDDLDELMYNPSPKEFKAMLIYEDLARERMREAERVAQEQRLVRRLNVIKRWERISAWASRRAQRAASLM